jgi:hypothetical protein
VLEDSEAVVEVAAAHEVGGVRLLSEDPEAAVAALPIAEAEVDVEDSAVTVVVEAFLAVDEVVVSAAAAVASVGIVDKGDEKNHTAFSGSGN